MLLGNGEVIADGTPHEVLSGSMAFSTQVNRLFGPGLSDARRSRYRGAPGVRGYFPGD